jgi:predicted O-methyltransferase YrrM
MRIEEVKEKLGDLPHMTFGQAQKITNFILNKNLRNILELGFDYGVSTCYIAAILEEIGEGKITTIDLDIVRTNNPNIEFLLNQLNLSSYVNVYYEPTSYTWRLLKLLESNYLSHFDLCYFDGAHDWYVDGFAFFLVDRLLKPGGWIIFDDLNWTFDTSMGLKNSIRVKEMPLEERITPQVKKVYELLVKTHPSYGNFGVDDDWAFAQKVSDFHLGTKTVRSEVVIQKEYVGLGALLEKIIRKILKSFK